MRKGILLITVCLSLFWGQAYAQRYLPGQKGIQFTTGTVDGFKLNKGDGQAFCFGTALSTYTKSGNRWVFGAEYLEKKYDYDATLIPVTQITGEGGFYYNFLSGRNKVVFFSLGVSALAGYETVNWGKEMLKDGATLESEDHFIYGPAITFEMETFLTDRIAFLLNVRERCLFGSSVGKFHTQIGVGVKIFIN